jgi:hypothetical protein
MARECFVGSKVPNVGFLSATTGAGTGWKGAVDKPPDHVQALLLPYRRGQRASSTHAVQYSAMKTAPCQYRLCVACGRRLIGGRWPSHR